MQDAALRSNCIEGHPMQFQACTYYILVVRAYNKYTYADNYRLNLTN